MQITVAKVLQSIFDFFNKNWQIIVIIILALTAMNLKWNNDKKEVLIRQQASQIRFYNDTISSYKNKNNELSHERSAMHITLQDLKKSNDSLYQMVKAEPDVRVITRVVTEIKTIRDTIISSNTEVIHEENMIVLNSFYEDESISFDFGHQLTETDTIGYVTNLSARIDFTVGIKETDGISKAFVTFRDPRFIPTTLDGIILENKQGEVFNRGQIKRNRTRHSIGPNVSASLTSDGIRPTIGIGYQFGVIRW